MHCEFENPLAYTDPLHFTDEGTEVELDEGTEVKLEKFTWFPPTPHLE